jgi:hypothetical protein
MKRQIILGIAIAIAAFAGVASGDGGGKAKGKQIHYVGIHPIPKQYGGGICHIEGPHIHIYAPADKDMVQYRDHDGDHYFVGDPVAYGWDGDKHAYDGPHPIYVDYVVDGGDPGEPVYCYIEGPHFHVFEPPVVVSPDFKVVGGAYFYIGTPPPTYVEARPQYTRINAIYTPIEYERPVVTVEPPAAWITIRYPIAVVEAPVVVEPAIVAPAHVEAGVTVVAPAIEIRPPSISVGIGIGVGVGVVGGGGVIVDGGHGHHDNGRHEGWYKNKGGKGGGGGGGKGKVVIRSGRR